MLWPHRSHTATLSTSYLEERVEGPFFIALILAGSLRRLPPEPSLDREAIITLALMSVPRFPARFAPGAPLHI